MTVLEDLSDTVASVFGGDFIEQRDRCAFGSRVTRHRLEVRADRRGGDFLHGNEPLRVRRAAYPPTVQETRSMLAADARRKTGLLLEGKAIMGLGDEHDAVRKVVIDYLEGMFCGDEERLRRAFHPGALQVGHFADAYEFLSLEQFIDWLKQEESAVAGTPYVAELLSIEVTGTVAVAKLTNTCFGADFTDYLVMVKDRPDHTGRWQIVTKAYHAQSGRGLSPAAS